MSLVYNSLALVALLTVGGCMFFSLTETKKKSIIFICFV